MNYKLYDVVRLIDDVFKHNLKKNEKGTIIHIFTDPDTAYEVEFVNKDGSQKAQLVLKPEEIEIVKE